MNIDEITEAIGSEDPASGLRAALALHRIAERVEARQVAVAGGQGGPGSRSARRRGSPGNPCTPNTESGFHDDCEGKQGRGFKPWATAVYAREEARRRGNRRVGTEDLVLGLLREPDVAQQLGRDLGRRVRRWMRWIATRL